MTSGKSMAQKGMLNLGNNLWKLMQYRQPVLTELIYLDFAAAWHVAPDYQHFCQASLPSSFHKIH